MRFILDEGLSPRVLDLMAAAGHDVVHVRDIGLQSTPDPAVLAVALEQRRVLVTLDTDFGALLALSGARQPSVILFRGEVTRRPEGQAMLLLANLDQITARRRTRTRSSPSTTAAPLFRSAHRVRAGVIGPPSPSRRGRK